MNDQKVSLKDPAAITFHWLRMNQNKAEQNINSNIVRQQQYSEADCPLMGLWSPVVCQWTQVHIIDELIIYID